MFVMVSSSLLFTNAVKAVENGNEKLKNKKKEGPVISLVNLAKWFLTRFQNLIAI